MTLLIVLGFIYVIRSDTSSFMKSLALVIAISLVGLDVYLYLTLLLPFMKQDDFSKEFQVDRPRWNTSEDYEGHPLFQDFEKEFLKFKRIRSGSTAKTYMVWYDFGQEKWELLTVVNWKGSNRFRVIMNHEAVDSITKDQITDLETFFDTY